MLGRLQSLIEHPHVVRYICVVALLLTLPSISDQWVFDDYVLGVQVRNPGELPGLTAGLWGDLFTFTSGQPARNRSLMAQGVLLPFWTDPQHLNAFLRPLSSWTHWLDFTWFPDSARLMHVHSWLWFLLLLWVTRNCYREIAESGHNRTGETTNRTYAAWAVTVPFALFAIDDVHGATLSWISNRNALVALCCALPALTAHARAVRRGGTLRLWIGPLWFALGLAAGETAIGVLGYLAAHALVLERDSWGRRALRLIPYGLCLVLWRVIYRSANLGSYGSGGYHDPVREPGDFLIALAQNLPILIGSQLTFPYADAAFWGPPSGVTALAVLSVVLLAIVLASALPALRSDRLARFYALGALLAAVPVSASVPGQRLLLVVSIGGAGFVARWLYHLLRPLVVPSQTRAHLDDADRSPSPDRPPNPGPGYCTSSEEGHAAHLLSRRALLVAAALLLIHGPAAASALPVASRSMTWVGQLSDHITQPLPQDDSVRDRTFVIVNAPFDVMASYEQARRAYLGIPRPAHLYWLSSASSPLQVVRKDERSLVITPEEGFLWSPQERHYRRELADLAPGSSIVLPNLTAQVLSRGESGRPSSIRFEFPTSLESDELMFFIYEDGRYVPWKPPRCGRGQHFRQQSFFTRLIEQVVARD